MNYKPNNSHYSHYEAMSSYYEPLTMMNQSLRRAADPLEQIGRRQLRAAPEQMWKCRLRLELVAVTAFTMDHHGFQRRAERPQLPGRG